MSHHTFDTVVIGAGQAGLAMGWHLQRIGHDFAILDGRSIAGATWSERWDSLRLFTPAKFSGLPGRPFPAAPFYLPTKDEVSAYLQDYVLEFKLPVVFDRQVERLSRDGDEFVSVAGPDRYFSRNVVVATGAYSHPYVPDVASELDTSIIQLHSSAYRNPSQIPEGDVLVVGAGNSGAEIAVELAGAGHPVTLSGRDTGRIPADTLGRLFGGRLYWWVISHVLSRATPMGRKVAEISSRTGTPLIGIKPSDVMHAGVDRVARVSGSQNGWPVLEDGRKLNPAAIVWATGYRRNYDWIDLPVFDEARCPRHNRGVASDVPGLFFLGLHFQFSLSSALLGGVGRDAEYLVTRMSRRVLPLVGTPTETTG
jgi:putative flavoprotein involved in K+ transport